MSYTVIKEMEFYEVALLPREKLLPELKDVCTVKEIKIPKRGKIKIKKVRNKIFCGL